MSVGSGYSGTVPVGTTVTVTTDYRPHGDLAAGERDPTFFPLAGYSFVSVDATTWDGNTVTLTVAGSGGGADITQVEFTADDSAVVYIPLGATVKLTEDGGGGGSETVPNYTIGHHI